MEPEKRSISRTGPGSFALYQHFSDLRASNKALVRSDTMAASPQASRTESFSQSAISPLAEDLCTECSMTGCEDPSCPAVAITPQCTDQCVVVACSDPDHVEMSCHGALGQVVCDASCGSTTDCSGDCTVFEEFLQCCTDYHAALSDPRYFSAESANAAFAWDPSLDALLCECNQICPCSTDAIESYTQISSENGDLQTMSHLESSDSDFLSSESSQSRVCTPAPAAPSIPAVAFPQSAATAPQQLVPNSLSCMWGNCNAGFSSLSDLVGHVNLEHLRLPTQAQPAKLPLNPNVLSCLWADCNVYPSPDAIPGPSSGNQINAAIGVLATHLMQDHLGLPSSFPSVPENYTPTLTPASIFPSPQPPPVSAPSPSSPPRSPISSSISQEHNCAGTHACLWRGCSDVFTSCDELTSHLTVAHVGAGKARYECFWDECSRHSDNGFSSKQKICRHLQSHTGHRPFQCKVCKLHFSEAATLQQHMRRHTLEKPYICDVPGCGKAFSIAGALTIHKRTHNGHKPFKCTYCDKAFAESSNLSKHLRTHTGERPYMCSEPSCGRSFARPDQLTRHMGVHRGKKEEAREVHAS